MVDSGAVRLAFEEGLGMGKNRQKKAFGAARGRAGRAWEKASGIGHVR